MEIVAVQENRTAYFSNIAIHQLQNMMERLHALADLDGLSEQIKEWNEQNAKVLPKGRGEVVGEFPEYTLTILWGEQAVCETNKIGQSGCLKIKFQR